MPSMSAMSHGSVVGIATAYGLDSRGVWVLAGSRIFTCPYCPDRLWDQSNLLSNVYKWALSLGGEADHLPLNSAEVKKKWIYTSTPSHVFMTYSLIS
jgi:hypothetical protein